MQAIILAAGIGSRLKEPLNKLPKSLLKFKKKTILYYLLKYLISNNIKNINLVTGYKQNLIKKYVIKEFGKKIKFRFIYNKYYKKRGNIYSVFLSDKFINEKVIIFNADIIVPEKILKRFILNSYQNMFLVNQNKFINKDDIVFECNSKKLVNKVYIKSIFKINNKNLSPSAGVVKMSLNTFRKYIHILKSLDLDNEKYYEKGYKKLIKLEKFKLYKSNSKIIEIDTKEDYEKLLINLR